MLKEQYVVSGSRLAVLVTPVSCRLLGRSAVRISQHFLLEEGLLHFMSRIRTSGLGVVYLCAVVPDKRRDITTNSASASGSSVGLDGPRFESWLG